MKKPIKQEIAHKEKGSIVPPAYLDRLIENPDTILRAKGPDMEVYRELLRDDQVLSTFQQRRRAVIQSEWEVTAASDSAEDTAAADFIKEQITALDFDQKTEKMLYGLFYGYSVAECMWGNDGQRVILEDILVRRAERFQFGNKGELYLMTPKNPNGLLMPDNKFWTFSAGADHDDNPYGQGLAHSLYWPVFFKRSDIKFWLIFLEKFGMPSIYAKVPDGMMNDAKMIDDLIKRLEAIQTDSASVVPQSAEVALLEAARTGTVDYDTMRSAMDKAVSKIILSQTMTTDDGSSLSQAKVHADVRQEVVKGDADLICKSMNRTVIKWLTEWNFPNAKPPQVWRNTDPEENLNERAERDQKIHALGYDPTEEYIEETYGPGWEKRETPEPGTAAGPGPLPPEFQEISNLLQGKTGHRADQQEIVDAAAYMASQYKELYGKRIDQLLAMLDETDDLATFQEHLTALFADPADQEAAEKIRNATFYGRLMGIFRGEKK